MLVNVDMDGVVYDMVGVLQQRLIERTGIDLPVPDSWNFGNWPLEEMGLTVQDMFEGETSKLLFSFGYPIPGSLGGVLSLVEAGHEVRMVTHKLDLGRQSWHAAQDTIGWLRGQGLLDYVEVVFTHGLGKQGYPADVVIDDNPALSWVQAGAYHNLLFDQPWNQTIDHNCTLIERVSGWAEIVELLT